MILLITLIAIVLFLYQFNYKNTGFYPLITIFISVLFFFIFLIEVYLTPLQYFISDEIGYWNAQITDINISLIDRLIWYSINYYLKNIDFLGSISIKLINIPILIITLYFIWKIFHSDRRVFLISLLLPYFALLATKNLRDILVMFLIVSSLFLYNKSLKGKIISFLPLLLLMFIRPFIGFITIAVVLLEVMWRNSFTFSFKEMRFTVNRKFILIFLGSIIAFWMLLSIPYVNQRIYSYVIYFNFYLFDAGYDEKVEGLGSFMSNNKLLNYIIGLIRYIFTPLPTSMALRMFSGGSEQWGLFDDIIRTINQLFYYFFLFYAIFNIKSIVIQIRKLNPAARQFLGILICHVPLYTFFGYGVAHQRNKLPFQLAIFLLFIINTHYNYYKTTQNIKEST